MSRQSLPRGRGLRLQHLLVVKIQGVGLQSELVRLPAGLLGKDRHVGQVRQIELLVQQAPLHQVVAHIPQIHPHLAHSTL